MRDRITKQSNGIYAGTIELKNGERDYTTVKLCFTGIEAHKIYNDLVGSLRSKKYQFEPMNEKHKFNPVGRQP